MFTLVQTMPAAHGSGWWVPIVNGTDRLGVIEFTVTGGIAEEDDLARRRCETMAGLIGHLVTVTAPKGDLLFQVRRARPMSNSAELLAQMLPPLTSGCRRLVISAVLEPRYDVGGDGYDYAIDGPLARMMIFDGVGRGLKAAWARRPWNPGDRLLLYTDGVTEARDTHGEQFGIHRLINHVERHAAAGLPARKPCAVSRAPSPATTTVPPPTTPPCCSPNGPRPS